VGRKRGPSVPAALNEACEYPDGTKVLAAETLEVRGGEIVRQVNVETWDE